MSPAGPVVLVEGQILDLLPRALLENGAIENRVDLFSYSSDEPTVVFVDNYGRIYAYDSTGIARITASYGNSSATIVVSVSQRPITLSRISFDEEGISL